MTFGQDPAPVQTEEVLTPEVATIIFDKLKTASPTTAFTSQENSEYPFSFFVEVLDEFNRLHKEFTSYMSGKLLTPEVATYTDEGEKVVEQPAVYYVPTTETDLLAQVESDLLDKKDVLNEIEPGGIWENYKSSFNETE